MYVESKQVKVLSETLDVITLLRWFANWTTTQTRIEKGNENKLLLDFT